MTKNKQIDLSPPCAPAGSMVNTTRRESVPIETLVSGDSVLSFNRKKQGFTRPREIVVGVRPYEGYLHGITTSDHQAFTTPNHKWLVRMKKGSDPGYIVYLMRKGDWFRIGRCLLFHERSEGRRRFHLQARMWNNQADSAWILRRLSTEAEAAVYEEYAATHYGISEWIFAPANNSLITPNETARMFHMLNAEDQLIRATTCLRDHGLDIQYPLIARTQNGTREAGTYCMETQALNIIPEVMEVPIATSVYGKMDWLTVERNELRHYDGLVYSLDVQQHHKYIQDGLVTCNSIPR